jgi:hypothetical protein
VPNPSTRPARETGIINWLRWYVSPEHWHPLVWEDDYHIFGDLMLSDLREVLREYDRVASPLSPPDDGGTTVCETCHVRVASVTVLDRLRENFRQADESRSTNATLLDRALGENAVLAQRVQTLEEALRAVEENSFPATLRATPWSGTGSRGDATARLVT